jgi:hypothetical protein
VLYLLRLDEDVDGKEHINTTLNLSGILDLNDEEKKDAIQ